MTEDDVEPSSSSTAATFDDLGAAPDGSREPPPPDLDDGRDPLPPSRAHRPRGLVGGRGRAGARGLRARGQARGHLGPVAADRAPGPAVDRRRARELLRARARVRRRRARADHPGLAGPARDARLLAPRAWTCTRASTPRACRAASRARRASARAAADDIPFIAEVDRFVRGGAHGADIETLSSTMGQTLLMLPERGYAVFGDGRAAACSPRWTTRRAAELLRGALGRGCEDERHARLDHGGAAVGGRGRASRPGSTSAAPTAPCSWAATSAASRPTCRAAPSCELWTQVPPSRPARSP